MLACPSCGHVGVEGAAFCAKCGTSLLQSPFAAPPGPAADYPRPRQPYDPAKILTYGILSLVFNLLIGIPAWVMGNSALRIIDSGEGDERDRTVVKVGRDVGRVMSIIGLLYIGFIIVLVGVGAFAGTKT